MVEIEIKRRPKPEYESPLPTRAADGTGWVVTCSTCERTRTVGRQAIASGAWLRCPWCEQAKERS
ncbi:hypothetical protein [Nitrolancea hollandica]|uniref:hypothetical protein n=1 Tax=Nitrolancea hollandica TaxID=1206749 RepID=UPI00030D2524|nr:hypothetical protein [Nitrolancea hollandica]